MNIAIICARKNSSRIKGKNFLKIGKKKMIDHTVDAAIKSKIFDKIMINTDHSKYKYYRKNSNVEIFIREKRLGTANVRVLDVIKDMIIKREINFDVNLFILFPTCPLRNSADIIKSNKIFRKYHKKKQVVSVSEYLPSIEVAFYINKKNLLKNKFLKKYNQSPGNNNHNKNYFCNYSIIINKVEKIMSSKKLVNENSIPYIMPFERSIDIDEPSQLAVIKKIIKK